MSSPWMQRRQFVKQVRGGWREVVVWERRGDVGWGSVMMGR
jgi:hypothetical protein